MIDLLNYIVWQPDLEAFHLGPISVRWYGLMWIIGLAMAYLVVRRLYKEQQIKEELFDPLFLYCFLGILIGARLGHCIFYEPDYFLASGEKGLSRCCYLFALATMVVGWVRPAASSLLAMPVWLHMVVLWA